VGKKIGSFGFLRLACGSAKTKCAYLRVGFFSMLHNFQISLVPLKYLTKVKFKTISQKALPDQKNALLKNPKKV
jgi:hypothetical protein